MRVAYYIIQVILLLSFSLKTFGQGIIYNTYEDYQKKEGAHFEGYSGMKYSINGVASLLFVANGNILKVKTAKIWGFEYKGQLFRICSQDGVPAMLRSVGEIHYYENGLAYLPLLSNGNTSGRFNSGVYCYISERLETEVVSLPLFKLERKEKVIQMIINNPRLQGMIDCMGRQVLTSDLGRECVNNFQGGFIKLKDFPNIDLNQKTVGPDWK